MKKVGAYKVKTQLPALLKEVAEWKRICITRKDVSVAMLVPAARADKASVLETIRKIREFRVGVGPAGVPIREMIGEDRLALRRAITSRLRAAREEGPVLGTGKIVAALRKDRGRR